MNESAELYDMNGFKFKDSDLVSSWIGSLLDEVENRQSSKNSDYLKEPARIIAYPVERILTPRNEAAVISNPGDFYLEEVKKPEISPSVKINPEKEIPYFTFTSGNSLYGIPAFHINEIIKYKEPVNIPSKKIGLLGLIPYRAKIIPVYNFSSLVLPSADVKTICKYIVICVYEGKLFGLCIEDIKNIIKVKNKNLISSATFRFWSSNKICSDVFEGESGKFYSSVDIKSIYNYLKS